MNDAEKDMTDDEGLWLATFLRTSAHYLGLEKSSYCRFPSEGLVEQELVSKPSNC